MATLLLRIDDMAPADGPGLERMLRDLPGVFGVVVSTATGSAEIDLEDDEIDLDTILDRIREAGFRPRICG